MRRHFIGVAVAFALTLGVSGSAAAQTMPAVPSPAAPASFDPHDLSGVWMQDRPRPGRVPCAKTVPESDVFKPLGLALSEKQIPQITENTEKSK